MGLIEREDENGVAVLFLNRPERRNALSGELIGEIENALNTVERDASVRAVVLSGRGKGFCAGGDLADGMGGSEGFIGSHQQRGRYAGLLARLPKLKQPVIAALNGDALGGGLGLALACDLVVADAEAQLGTPEINVGLFPMIILAALQRHVPRKALMELVLTGAKVSAERAQSLGMVNRVSAPGQALADGKALATEIASKSPVVAALGKAAFYAVEDLDYESALRYLHPQLTLNLMTEDAAEGVSAFLSRRPPVWKGR